MAKDKGIRLKYRYGKLPEDMGELMNKADEADVRVLLTLSLLAKKTTAEARIDDISALSGIDARDVRASLKFWRGAGVVEDIELSESAEVTKKPVDEERSAGKQTAHRGGAVERSNITEDYRSGELADIMDNRIVSPLLIDEAQRIFGKMFRTYDIGILVGIVERLGFEEEAVLLMLNYVAGKGKKTMRYAETLAMSFYDEGITSTEAVSERISRMEKAGELIEQIKRLFGFSGRELTTSEKRFFTAWTEKYVYDMEVIRLAYDITVDNTQKPLPKYANTILERWYTEGLRTAEEVRGYLDRQATEKGGTSVAKSYDTDEFFEAALKRSYEELK